MNSLSSDQKQLIFDYFFGLTNEREKAEAEKLLASNPEAADLHSRIGGALSPLASLHADSCPDDLTERTLARALGRESADAGHDRLEHLLDIEKDRVRTIKLGLWRNFGDMIAVAAVLMLVAAVLVPTLSHARHHYGVKRCQANLGSLYGGFSAYAGDHDGKLPAVTTGASSYWWKLGDQGQEPQSNSRAPFLLVKGDYAEPKVFLCPSRKREFKIMLSADELRRLNDFPNGAYISFSLYIRCNKAPCPGLTGTQILMADATPLRELLPEDHAVRLQIKLSAEQLNSNSPNHGERGQNAMRRDGSVIFCKTRCVGDTQDDMYTTRAMTAGYTLEGRERPDCLTDVFLGP